MTYLEFLGKVVDELSKIVKGSVKLEIPANFLNSLIQKPHILRSRLTKRTFLCVLTVALTVKPMFIIAIFVTMETQNLILVIAQNTYKIVQSIKF